MGRGWLQALKPASEASDAADLKRAVQSGCSAALFLKRPKTLLEGSNRGKIKGDAYIRTLFEAQRESDEPILLVPQVFVWSKQPDQAAHSVFDSLLGPREWPGKIRTVTQFLLNYRHVTLRAGEPVDLKAFLATEGGSNGSALPDDVLVRRLTYTLLRRLERERRAVVGPTKKPADRLREEVVRSPKLQKIIHDMAGEGAAERLVITARAHAMLREMEASLEVNAVNAIQPPFEQVISRMYSGVEIDEQGLERLRAASKDGTLILLPSHKSHVDYMILTWIFLTHHLQLPLIAAGDNLNFFPVGAIFRRAGAFYIRRAFTADRLYGAVMDAYVRRLIKDNWSLEFFLEGGRSRTGKLLSPKVGLLSLVVDAALAISGRKVYFCPISIGYERVVEEKAFVHEVSGGEKKKEDMGSLLASAGLVAGRYGRLNVQFGELLTLDGVLRELDPEAGPASLAKMTPARRRAVVTRLAYRVMNEINAVTAVTPGALVASALLTHGRRGLSHPDLVRACTRLSRTLHAFGARFTPSLGHPGDPGAIRIEAIREACELFVRAGHVEVHRPGDAMASAKVRPGPDAIYVVPDEARMSLDLSKNIVVHFFVSRAMVATAILAPDAEDGEEPRAQRLATAPLKERVRALSRLFKYEFQFRADATFDQIFDETLDAMVADGELVRDGETVALDGDEGRAQVVLYAQIVKNFVEGYRIAARGLTALLKGPLPIKDLTKRAISAGERMFLAGEIERREAVSRPVLENAYAAFVDQGYLTRSEGKLSLAESYASAATVRTIEARIAGYLTRRADD
jgi:glycerol-3-phosphate O-acyltransferase